MVYENLKIYGPYKGKDGRLRVVTKDGDGKLNTVSYPKYLMEVYLDRYLTLSETIDHIDGNFLNNDFNNLRVLERILHTTLDASRNKDVEVICNYCGEIFTIKGNTLHQRNRRDNNHSGYFCSRSCTGKYGRDIQLGLRNPESIPTILVEKYRLK